MTTTLDRRVHFGTSRRRRTVEPGSAPEVSEARVPRVTRLMALAIRLDGMIRSGEVKSYAELGVLGHVTRARITQIMNLLNLAPDIQEAILDLPSVVKGKDPITERVLRPVVAEVNWAEQRRMWRLIAERSSSNGSWARECLRLCGHREILR